MLPSYRAACGTFALRKLGLRVSWCIVTFDIFHVTTFTEVGGPPAEPVANRAAELALEINVVGAMFWAVYNTSRDTYGWAFTTQELLWFKLLILIIEDNLVVRNPTKVKWLALEALIIFQHTNCVFLKISEKFVWWIFQTFVLVEAFLFGTLKCLSLQIILNLDRFNDFHLHLGAMSSINALLAVDAVEVAKLNTRSKPSTLQSQH